MLVPVNQQPLNAVAGASAVALLLVKTMIELKLTVRISEEFVLRAVQLVISLWVLLT